MRYKIGEYAYYIKEAIRKNADTIASYAQQYNLSPHFVAAIILTEQLDMYRTDFITEDMTDEVGGEMGRDTSIGLCQVKPSTFRQVCAGMAWPEFDNKTTEELSGAQIRKLLEDDKINIMAGCATLSKMRGELVKQHAPPTKFKLLLAQMYTSGNTTQMPEPPFTEKQLKDSELVRTRCYAEWVLINENLIQQRDRQYPIFRQLPSSGLTPATPTAISPSPAKVVSAETAADIQGITSGVRALFEKAGSLYSLEDTRRYGLIIADIGYLGEEDKAILELALRTDDAHKKPKFFILAATDKERDKIMEQCPSIKPQDIKILAEFLHATTPEEKQEIENNVEQAIAEAIEMCGSEIGKGPIGIITTRKDFANKLIAKLEASRDGARGKFVICQELPEAGEGNIQLGDEFIPFKDAMLFRLVFAELLKIFTEYITNPDIAHEILSIIPPITDDIRFSERVKILLQAKEAVAAAA
jgi:hypothetical protein